MKIAIFSDVHGNYVNLLSFYEASLKLGIDKYICLGDLCNYYPDNEKVINFIKEKKFICLLGNHDKFYLPSKTLSEEKKKAYNFKESTLNDIESINFLKSLPLKYELSDNGASLLFCHASPKDLLYTYIYPDSDLSQYKELPYQFIFVGHTHRQFKRNYESITFCNVGSIGLPRDNGLLMSFAVFDTITKEIVLYRKKINESLVLENYKEFVNQDVIQLLSRSEEINFKYILLDE